MSTTTVINNEPGARYGAPELKKLIQKNTVIGFVIAAATILLLLLIYLFVFVFAKDELAFKAPLGNRKFNLSDLPPPPTSSEPPPVPPPSAPIQAASGPAARAGTPVPVPDALISPELKDFASMNEVSRASAEGGDGQDLGGFSDGIGDAQIDYSNVSAPQEPTEADPDEFVYVEEEAQPDYADIQSRLQYPDIARRAKVEGKVTLRVLVGVNGRPKKVIVLESSHEWFTKPAQEVIMDSRTVIKPAIQNKHAVETWLTVPIVFKLSK